MNINLESIEKKLFEAEYGVTKNVAKKISVQLEKCVDSLKPNIVEWLETRPFSDIWIRDKYCLNAVLKIRGNPASAIAIADAILALNAYAVDSSNEHLIWQKRM